MRDILTTFLIFGLLPFVLRKPYIGVLLWSWLGYMNPHKLGWGFARDFQFAYIVALVTLLSLIFNKEKIIIPKNSLIVVWVLFLAWMVITTIFAIFPDVAFVQLIKVAKIQFFAFLTLFLFGSIERINKLIWVIVVSLSYFGVKGGLFTIAHGGSFIVWGPNPIPST